MSGDTLSAVLVIIGDITLKVVIPLLIAYLIGSLPTGYLVARLRRGIDIRQVGSRNMGAMNVFYRWVSGTA